MKVFDVTRIIHYGGTPFFLCLFVALGASAIPSPPGGFSNDPWGDVNGDGKVTIADPNRLWQYLYFPATLTLQQKERVRRYGDVSGVVNRNTVGNSVIDAQDTLRHVLLAGGVIDSGTAGVYNPAMGGAYGDVNGDGVTDILDAVIVQRHVNGSQADPALVARITARGGGDISPTIPYVSFGDGLINYNDATVMTDRADGVEANRPAYADYWPMRAADGAHPEVVPDQYAFTDLNGLSGDATHQVAYITHSPVELGGYTITEVAGTDASVVGAFKGADGSVYVMYLRYPPSFGPRRIDFQSPIKLIDSLKVNPGDSWTGLVTAGMPSFGRRLAPYTVTVLGDGDVYTPAAGAFPDSSRWSKTLRVRLDIALAAYQPGQDEMQQAFFFDFEPFIGLVQRGQTAQRGAPAPTPDKPFCVLTSATVRNLTYNSTTP